MADAPEPGFQRVWVAYPHFELRSRKAEARRVWKRLQLEEQVEQVLAWVDAMACSEDWQKDGGKFVPGMQVWLKGPDFSEEPPVLKTRRRDRSHDFGADRQMKIPEEQVREILRRGSFRGGKAGA